MKYLLSFVALAAASLASPVARAPFIVNTPVNVQQCIPTELTFEGGTGPFLLTINTPDANGLPLRVFDGITESPFIWNAGIRADIPLALSMIDHSDGARALSGVFTVQVSGDSSCLA